TASLYSEADAEYIQTPQFVVFVPNPTKLPYNDSALVKNGAKIIIDAIKDHPKLNNATYSQQIKALSECTISKSFMGPWDTCE
ncbi:hypothetical protein ELI65_30315, partial [Klebsiella pneumoniae]|nr:hypothetical protein [Klebsiella pneumoniae]